MTDQPSQKENLMLKKLIVATLAGLTITFLGYKIAQKRG